MTPTLGVRPLRSMVRTFIHIHILLLLLIFWFKQSILVIYNILDVMLRMVQYMDDIVVTDFYGVCKILLTMSAFGQL